jgi:lysophospholipase L1-like esterase
VDNEKTARYAEYNSTGPGANPSQRVSWARQLTKDEADKITAQRVLGGSDGWNPAATTGTAAAAETRHKVRIVLAGDSTVTDNAGWGTGFKELLKPDVECINLSRGGRSSKSFRDEGSWDKVLALKPDYVLIQFGHNDQAGHGPERETDPKTTYRQNMTRYVDEARAAGITPILVTPLTRREFGKDGKIHSTLAPYAETVREIASEKNVPLIDLQSLSIDYFDRLGPTGWQTLAPMKGKGYDGTHLNRKGSEAVGQIVVQALKTAVPALAPDCDTASPEKGDLPAVARSHGAG